MLIPLQDRALKNEARRQLETIKDTEHGNDSRPGSTGLEKDSSRLLKREAGYFHGYTYIFAETYGINSGLSNIIFVGLFIGVLLQLITVPFIVRKTNRQLERDGDAGQGTKLGRESSLLFAIYSAPFVPIGLFWMAWTDYASISVCSPILASVMVGAGIISIFLSAYMYIIDAYEGQGGEHADLCCARQVPSRGWNDRGQRADVPESGSALCADDTGLYQCCCSADSVGANQVGSEC
ncbi:hypothetical protein PMIN04_001669 [Paraphaeosphaeria minitans]